MESDETVETIRLGDGYIYAFIKYRDGVWSVVDEFFSENFFTETEAALEPDQRQICEDSDVETWTLAAYEK